MYATLPLLLAPGLGRFALVADLVLTVVAVAAGLTLWARARRTSPEITGSADVVSEAEAVVGGVADRQPA